MSSPKEESLRPTADVGGTAVQEPCNLPLPHPICATVKACVDVVAAVLLLIPGLPVIGLSWLLVKLFSPGPGFYVQTRLGKNGRPYRIIKIRSMHHNVEKVTGGAKWSTAGDTRIFKLGKLLRKTHLDELPQLFNVLKGEMSLVGPRPERPEIINTLKLNDLVPGYDQRLLVKPGVTGLAQLQLPADSDIQSVKEKVVYDLFYIRRQSLWLDLRLIVATAAKAAGLSPNAIRRIFLLPNRETIENGSANRSVIGSRFQPA
jgi:lipopolysaccharide/colanic/teichoic acid biosynthesis glycosyltransferase